MDRFADKYPSFTPYQYAANNPILFIDVNGDSIFIHDNGNTYEYRDGKLWNSDGTEYTGHIRQRKGFGGWLAKTFLGKYKGFAGQVYGALEKINNSGTIGSKLISDLVDASDDVNTNIFSLDSQHQQNLFEGNSNIRNVYWSKSQTGYAGDSFGKNSVEFSGFIALAHELGHSWDYQDGIVDQTIWIPASDMPDGMSRRGMEKVACGIENLIRAEHNMTRRAYYYKNKGLIPNFNF